MTSWTSWLSETGWGTREQAIPGEWAMLVLIIVAAGVFGFIVLWFTMLRHERTVLHRARHRASLQQGLQQGVQQSLQQEPGLIGASGAALFTGTRRARATEHEPIDEADSTAGDGDEPPGTAAGAAKAEAGADVDAHTEADAQAEAEADAHAEAEADAAAEPDAGDEPEPTEAAAEPEPARSEAAPAQSQAQPQPQTVPTKDQRKLTDEILSRVEHEIAARDGRRHWNDLAKLVHREFGVSVHPSTIQRALKKRRRAEAADPASA